MLHDAPFEASVHGERSTCSTHTQKTYRDLGGTHVQVQVEIWVTGEAKVSPTCLPLQNLSAYCAVLRKFYSFHKGCALLMAIILSLRGIPMVRPVESRRLILCVEGA